MAVEAGPMSGFRDLLAEQMIPRQKTLDTITGVYERYGFVPLKTPALERFETLTGKYGEEGQGLIYQFEDNGGRHVAMRYDQTVPLARVVAQHGSRLPTPYKRYALGEVWRGERPGAGRFREFTQFDADVVGSSNYLADTEVIAMMADSMSALGLDTHIRLNDRQLLDGLAKSCGIETEQGFRQLVGTIDKIDKIGKEAVLTEVDESFGEKASSTVMTYLDVEGNSLEKLERMAQLIHGQEIDKGVDNLTKIIGALTLAGYGEETVTFDQTIARGLDYYTSTIFETTAVNVPELGSVCSGGRYDNLIEDLGGPSMPAVGTSIGVDRLLETMSAEGKLAQARTNTQIFIANMDTSLQNIYFQLAQQLRAGGVPTEVILQNQKLGKQIRDISRLGVRNVIILGQDEVESGCIQLKDLEASTQRTLTIDELLEEFSIKDNGVE